MRRAAVLAVSLAAIAAASLAAPAHAQGDGREYRIDGAGATFAFPIMDLWRVEYGELNPAVKFNYQSIGSGGGVKQHIERTVAFSASDAPLTAAEYERAPGTLTIPAMIGAISIAYNVPDVPDSGLRLTAEALCGIYLGDIASWDDPAIAAENPDLDLPSGQIAVAHRSDGSGTTFAFTEYLAHVCPEWDERVGVGKSVPWPAGHGAGRGAAGNEGVAAIVTSTENSIGYVTLAYAFQTGMSVAAVENGDRTAFVLPTIESASAASEGASAGLPAAHESWEGVNLLAAPGEGSYPITSFSYVIMHPDLEGSVPDAGHARAAVDLVSWMITDGQEHSPRLQYVPIADAVSEIGLEGLSRVAFAGAPVLGGAAPGAAAQGDAAPAQPPGGGCLIATAAYGTELAPQVQLLREARGGELLSTGAGAPVMGALHTAYYAFSPAAADLQRGHPELREAARVALSPALHALQAAAQAGQEG